jgi:crotonobetainyl-CoA:carnitine CoA-transferase CaiB-like acyl-CoA transferase
VKLSATPGGPGAPAPLLGQHTSETLQNLLGLDAAEVRELAARGIIFEPDRPSESV